MPTALWPWFYCLRMAKVNAMGNARDVTPHIAAQSSPAVCIISVLRCRVESARFGSQWS
jgi:hypothetical protein